MPVLQQLSENVKTTNDLTSNNHTVFPLTSDNTEELLDPHVDIDPAEELVHVAPPLLQDGAGRLAHLEAGSAGSRYGAVSVRLACKHFAQPAQHELQPLLTRNIFKMKALNSELGSD